LRQRKTTATAYTSALQTTAKTKGPIASSASMRRRCKLIREDFLPLAKEKRPRFPEPQVHHAMKVPNAPQCATVHLVPGHATARPSCGVSFLSTQNAQSMHILNCRRVAFGLALL
jgi:hypothetical protein